MLAPSPAANLLGHGGPSGGDVARPGDGGVALLAGEAGAGEDEDALVGRGLALAGVDAFAVHQRVAVQHARAGAEEGWVHVGLLAFERGRRGGDVRLGGVHPPGIDAFGEEASVDLRPEELARVGVEGVVEGVGLANPVAHMLGEVGLIEEAVGVHLFGVIGIGIELAPDRDHEMGVQVVDGLDPADGIGKAGGIELVRAPGVCAPVLPVLHDVVEGNLALAELLDHVEELVGGLVPLARLPQAEDPVGQHGGFAGEEAIAGDDLIGGRAVDEGVIDAVADLRPEGGVCSGRRGLPLEGEGGLLLGIILDLDGVLVPGEKMDEDLIVGGVPVLTPVVHD